MRTLSLSQPYLLVTVGIPGSGKSFFAEKFAATFNAPYVKYDTIMAISGDNGAMSDTYAGYMLRELFKTQHTIVFDGHTATRAERLALKDLATSAGYACLFVWVQTDAETAKMRFVKNHQKSGRHATSRQYDTLLRQFAIPTPKDHLTVVVSGKHTYATQAKAVLKALTAAKQTARASKAHTHLKPDSSKRNIIIR